MARTLQLRLLGAPEVSLGGTVVTERLATKAQAMLYYLAVTGQPQSRSVLASLLWGDMPEAGARTNLRKTLVNLRRWLEAYLELDGQTIAFKPDCPVWVDVADFVASAELTSLPPQVERLQAAVELYRGDFLAGYYVRNAPDFETWVLAEQARLHELVIQALHTLTAHHAAQGEPAQGIASARRLLSLEPWREEAHRQLMQLLAQAGQRSAALAQFEVCRQALGQELGVEPGQETVSLYEQIRTGQLSRAEGFRPLAPPVPLTTPAGSPPRSTAFQNLPAQPSPFVGREKELTHILRRLTDRDCRLLTLVGPGGIGKTRLALQTAQTFIDRQASEDLFSHGIVFVPLAGVDSIGGMESAVAAAANFAFYSNVPPRQQLLSFLQGRNLLLILDNLEHLLEEGSELISEILTVAPGIRILVTSREALNLQGAWFHPVEGMPFPPPLAPSPPEIGFQLELSSQLLEKYDAVQLFVQSARRVRVEFSLAAEQAHVVRICQLVEGMPLGIELAAAWLKVLPAAKVAREIERGLDILSSRFQNVPERHRSIRAVFEHSWQHLAEEEQVALKRLSVFRGRFTEEAARQVADAPLPILALLVEKSLVRVAEMGRYQMHELLRQFASEKLISDRQTQAIAQERHSAYYLNFLQDREAMLTSPGQQVALTEIGEEIENIWVAWRWAVEQGYLRAIDQASQSIYNFYVIRSRYQEGKEIFADAIAQLEAAEHLAGHPDLKTVLNRLLARQGAFYYFLGDYELAGHYLEDSLKLASQPVEQGFILRMLGEVAVAQGKRSMAEAFFDQSLAISREIEDLTGVIEALRGLADMANSFGDFAKGKELAAECLAISRRLGQPAQVARALAALAWPTNCSGGYRESEGYWQESLAISQEIGDQFGIADALSMLGWVAWCQGADRLQEAISYHKRALAICREIGHRRNLAMCLGDLALAVGETGNFDQAVAYGREGLAVTEAIGHLNLKVYNLYCLGAAACGLGDFQTGREYLLNALQIAWGAQVIDHTTIALFYLAALLAQESDQGDMVPPLKFQQQLKALELLTLVINHPACWQPIKDRATRLQAQLEAGLPANTVRTASVPRKARTLAEIMAEILHPPH